MAQCLVNGNYEGATVGYYVQDNIWYEVGTSTPPDPDPEPPSGGVPQDPDISDQEKEIFYTFYMALISISLGAFLGVILLVFYASLAIMNKRR